MSFNAVFGRIGHMLSPTNKRTESGEVGSFRLSYGKDVISRTAIINHLAKRIEAQRYLEIGVRDGSNYDKVQISNKIGVDPAPKVTVTHQITSDEYFAAHTTHKFDIIFIDGLHLEEFVVRDIENSLAFLNCGGYIVVHDCNPPSEFHQRENYEIGGEFPPWNGTVWRGWLRFRANRPDLVMQVVDTDFGVGVISHGNQETILTSDISYDEFAAARTELLPLISVRSFLSTY